MDNTLKPLGSRRALALLGGAAALATLAPRKAKASYLYADHVPYLPPFTSAVLGTIGGKLAQVVNVVDFGADPSGVTDSTAKIQAAINTGNTVYIPPGTFMTTAGLTVAKIGQIIQGAGIAQTILKVKTSGFSGTAAITFTSGEPGPQLNDLWITCDTPSVSLKGIDATSTPRFKLNRVRVTKCQYGVNMPGNCGGANLTDVELWNTSFDIAIDGCLDCVYISGLRSFPFDDGALTNINHTGISSGRCDGLFISNSMFICGTQIALHHSTGFGGVNPGDTFAIISNTDFDTLNGLAISSGGCELSSCFFSGGTLGGITCGSNISMSGGQISLSSCFFTNAASTMVGITGGSCATIQGCEFEGAGNTNPYVVLNAPAATMLIASNNNFIRTSGVGGTSIVQITAGRATLIGNRCPVDGTGNFIAVSSDNWHRVVYNATGSWTNSFPTPSVGIYSPN